MTEQTTLKTSKPTVSFTTDKETKDWIFQAAADDERTVSVFINRLIKKCRKQTVDQGQQS